MRVFVGGSKALKALPKAMSDKLVELMEQDAEIIVGDCKGADELIQRYMRQRLCRDPDPKSGPRICSASSGPYNGWIQYLEQPADWMM